MDRISDEHQSVIRVAAIQMSCIPGDKEQNLRKASRLIKEACEREVQLIVLPELFSTGYFVKELDMDLAEHIPGKTTLLMERIAKERDLYICGAILEHGESKGVIYDTAVLVSPNGLEAVYRKVLLWDSERTRFKHGCSFPVVRTKFGILGMQICYEVGWPEVARILTLKGADILICTAAFGKERYYAWDLATRSRALENGVFLVASNRSGKEGEKEFASHSRIVDPKGNILAEASQIDEVIVASIDLDDVVKQRRAVPYLRDYETAIFQGEMMKLFNHKDAWGSHE